MKQGKIPPSEKNTSLKKHVLLAVLLICSVSFSSASINASSSYVNTASATLDTLPKTHPSLLFTDVTQTPGYRYRTREPWATWENYIHIGRTSNMVSGAMDHLILGTSDGLNYAKSALINFKRTPGDGRDLQRIYELNDVLFAYDFIQPEFTSSEDQAVRAKIAELADQVYFDLNHYESLTTIDNDLECVDYHFRAYMLLGIAGMLMDDYTATTLPHGSSPQKWLAAGTQYLFVSDPLHDRNGVSMFSACINSQGIDLVAGDYRGYYSAELISLVQVYSRYYNRSMLDDYPVLKKWVLAPLYYYMPDKYDTNRASGGQVKYEDAMLFINVLDSVNRTYMWKYYNDLMNDETLPYSRTFGAVNDYHPLTEVAYSVYSDYSSLGESTPVPTSRFTDSDYQIFRKDWTDQSSWLSFVTFRSEGTENRFMNHNDQMSFELYDKGDYVLADSGEVKYRVPGGYGPKYSKGHNAIMFTSPGNSKPAGVYKGFYDDLKSNASLYYMSDEFVEYVQAGINITYAENTDALGEADNYESVSMANPMKWTRSILYPNKEYFLVFDHVENNVQRRIDTLYHLSSFKHDTTTSSYIGHVYGDLSIENQAVNWLGQTYNAEVAIRDASDLKWNTTSPYNQKLQTELYSIPKSPVTVEKFWLRVGGFDLSSEVDHPLVRYKYDTTGNMNRITSINTRYQSGPVLAYSEITVTGGTGSALKITNGTTEDIALLGQGQLLTADKLKTDAYVGFVRSAGGSLTTMFLKDGTTLFYDGISRFNSSKDVAASLQYSASRVYGRIEGTGSYNTAIRVGFNPTTMKYNGQSIQYTYSSGVVYATLSGAGELEVTGEGSDVSIVSSDIFFPSNVFQGSLASISARVRNTGSQAVGSFTVKFYDGSALVGTSTVSSLAAGAYSDKLVPWTPSTGGPHTITVTVDADGSIAELDELNNQATATVYVGYPADLTLSSSNITFSDSQPTEYENISIYVDVSNTGGTDVSSVVVVCFDGPIQTGKTVSSQSVVIPKNSHARLTYTWIATPSATHGIYVSIDPNNTVSESSETNNIAYRNIYVYSRPDLYINPANISSIQTTLYAGSPVTLRAKLYNLGESDSGVFSVRYSDGSTLIKETTTSVSGGSSVNADITWTPATSGNHNISVILDSTNVVSEPSKTNNAASKNFYVSPSVSTTTTSAGSTTTTRSTTATTPGGTTTTTTTTRVSTTTTSTTSTTLSGIMEMCCNEIDDDSDGKENGYDSDCANAVSLSSGVNTVCWWTDWKNYGANRDYYSGAYGCPAGSNISSMRIYLNTERNYDYFYVYNSVNSAQLYKSSGSRGNQTIGPFNANSVKFRFTSDNNVFSEGVKVYDITCTGPTVTTTTWAGTTTTTSTSRASTTTSTSRASTTTTSRLTTTTTSTTQAGSTTTNGASTTSTPGTTMTTTTLFPPEPPPLCAMPGDYDPCGVISLQEVVNYLNAWVADQASLMDVVNLINAWATS